MRGFIGRIDGEQNHRGDAGRNRQIGRFGHVAAGRCGHKFRHYGENNRLGHRAAAPVAGRTPATAILRVTCPTRCPGRARSSTRGRKQLYPSAQETRLSGREIRRLTATPGVVAFCSAEPGEGNFLCPGLASTPTRRRLSPYIKASPR